MTKRWWMRNRRDHLRNSEEIITCNRRKSCPLAHIPKSAPAVRMDLAALSAQRTKETDNVQREATETRRIVGLIVVSLAAKVMSTVRASLTLAEAGHGHEVDIPVRSALEALITALFIA